VRWAFDTVVAVALLALGLGATAAAGRNQPGSAAVDGLAYALVAVAALALVARRRWPLPTLAVTTVAVSVYLVLRYPYGPVLLTVVVAVYTVASTVPWRRSVPAAAAALVVLLTHLAVTPFDWIGLLPGASLVAVPFAVGATVRQIRESAVRARDERIRDEAYEARLRVAQEVHDVVGHGLAAINMQAEIALHVLPKKPEQAEAALTTIARTSKEALDELRATLAVVRRSDAAEQRIPGPGLAQVDRLVARLAGTGVPVSVSVEGEPRDLPAAVDLAAYRVVQESLTNVLRHAGKASATVRVTYRPDGVSVEVTDTGLGESRGTLLDVYVQQGAPAFTGQGINGMRMRVEAVGGEFTAGPAPGGGFRVHADLPLPGGAL
jgi:signal transduction histidine kinase